MTPAEPAPPERERRRYDSPVRRQRASETRERIVAAGAAILHEHPVWDWDALTIRLVAERAGVNQRTVYRHFTGERELRDAVMAQLEAEAGVALERLDFDGLQRFAERVLEYVSSFPLERRAPHDETLLVAHRRQRDALLAAVAEGNPEWPERDRAIAAAVLDVLWSVTSYERLVVDWDLDPKDAVTGVTWAMGLVEDAIKQGRGPLSSRSWSRSLPSDDSSSPADARRSTPR